MIKFLLFIVVATMFTTVYFVIKQITKNKEREEKQSIDNLSVDDLDELIAELKRKITIAEREAERGIVAAELKAIKLKAQLEKIEKLKSKFN
jgi:preprotein translocase subunit YajC